MNDIAEHVSDAAEDRRDHLLDHGIEHMNDVAEHVSDATEHRRDHLLDHRIEHMNDIAEHVSDRCRAQARPPARAQRDSST